MRPGKRMAWRRASTSSAGGLLLALGLLIPLAAVHDRLHDARGGADRAPRQGACGPRTAGRSCPCCTASSRSRLAFNGAGQWSLDHAIGWGRRRPVAGASAPSRRGDRRGDGRGRGTPQRAGALPRHPDHQLATEPRPNEEGASPGAPFFMPALAPNHVVSGGTRTAGGGSGQQPCGSVFNGPRGGSGAKTGWGKGRGSSASATGRAAAECYETPKKGRDHGRKPGALRIGRRGSALAMRENGCGLQNLADQGHLTPAPHTNHARMALSRPTRASFAQTTRRTRASDAIGDPLPYPPGFSHSLPPTRSTQGCANGTTSLGNDG